ncbi:MAG: FKBP-type peptidyl-prolyl cis-trans isomerase [Pseudomonadales bacterium]
MSKLIASELSINERSRVTLNFSVALTDGSLVDGTETGRPAAFTMGDGSLLPGFEQCLLGLRAGSKEQFQLAPDQAFGERQEDNVQRLRVEQFADMTLEPGLLISFATPEGELPGLVKEIDDQWVLVDFNHPLAGRTICFDVQIVQVETAR